MNSLHEYLLESLNDIKDVEDFLKNNYNGKWVISKKPNEKGLYEVSAPHSVISIKNKNIKSLTNGLFEFTNVGTFECIKCSNLLSLEGSPKEVGTFTCTHCNSIIDLTGSPEIVKYEFNCKYCNSLKSLIGSPKETEDFFIEYNPNLKDAKGAPEKVNNFYARGTGLSKILIQKFCKAKSILV